jgi:2-phospho-L-lactate guanylyltransferase (CobY/MobA/RfbA family)
VTERAVVVLARAAPALPRALVLAMLEDVLDVVSNSPLVTPVLAVAGGHEVPAERLTWPGTAVIRVGAEPTLVEVVTRAGDAGGPAGDAVDGAADLRPAAVAVLAGDVPDLPGLLLGKLFSALAGPRHVHVALCPAEGGGLVAAAVAMPPSAWLHASPVRLDDADAMASLGAAAPVGAVATVPGWHRIRVQDDRAWLDPGLEGWEATRAALAVHDR